MAGPPAIGAVYRPVPPASRNAKNAAVPELLSAGPLAKSLNPPLVSASSVGAPPAVPAKIALPTPSRVARNPTWPASLIVGMLSELYGPLVSTTVPPPPPGEAVKRPFTPVSSVALKATVRLLFNEGQTSKLAKGPLVSARFTKSYGWALAAGGASATVLRIANF